MRQSPKTALRAEQERVEVRQEALKPYLTPSEIAKLLRVSNEKVLGWIRRAELKAVNVSNGVALPRYRVSRESLDDFMKAREVPPPIPRSVRRGRRPDKPPEGGPIDPVLGEQLLKKKQAVKVGNTYYRVWNGMTLYF
jgi:excisionase family DNA binding protein